MKDLRLGLIGYGLWGRHHAEAIGKAPGATLVAIACAGAETAAAAKADFPTIPVSLDYRQLLERPDVDMGAALLPALVEIYIRLSREYRVPVLFPRRSREYASVMEFSGIPLEGYDRLLGRLETEGWPLIDHFRMTPGVPSAQSDRVYRNLVAGLPSGLTMVVLHPNKSGDIETIVPAKAQYRTEEHRILGDPEFREFLARQEIRTIGFQPLRQLLREKI
jgi:hypothetical protein